jgi:hypothetical protein
MSDTQCPHVSRATCRLKLDEVPEAIQDCNHVLMRIPDNVKALFRRGQVASPSPRHTQCQPMRLITWDK